MDCGCWTANSWKHPEVVLAGPSRQVKAREGWSRLNHYGERPVQAPGGDCPEVAVVPGGLQSPEGPGKHSTGATTKHGS